MDQVLRNTEPAQRICRGALRLFESLGYAGVAEHTLKNGRRADLILLGARGDIIIVEVKSGVPDFRADQKWQDYLDFCDQLYFAVDDRFPTELIPKATGLVIADNFGGAVLRDAPVIPLPSARRKAMTLKFAHAAANRLSRLDATVLEG